MKTVWYLITSCVFLLPTFPVMAGIKDDVVAAWLFDEGVGETAGDAVNDHDGELIGDVLWNSNGRFGGAVEFLGVVGTGDHIEVPDTEALSLEEWTITAWVKLQFPDHGDWAVIAVKDPANGFQNYALDLNTQGNVVSEVTSGGQWSDTVSFTSVYDDTWHFVASSYDGETLRAFVDGSLEAEQDFGPGDLSDAPLSIGDRLDGSQPILGLVDDLGLFRTALDEEDLLILMDQGLEMILSLGQIPGDFNGNGALDSGDIDELTRQSASLMNSPSYDLNADSRVDDADIRLWISELFNSWGGDANLDGEFNSSDLVVVLGSGAYETNNDAVWSSGDFNGDGRANTSDLVAALAGGGYEQGQRAAVKVVPEPGTPTLMLFGLIQIVRYRRPVGAPVSQHRANS